MENKNLLKYILIFLFCIFIFQSFYYYPKLPDTIASNYNSAGEPNGWMSIFFCLIWALFVLAPQLLGLPDPRWPTSSGDISST